MQSLLIAKIFPFIVEESGAHYDGGETEGDQEDIGGHGVALQHGGPGGQLLVIFHLIDPEHGLL